MKINTEKISIYQAGGYLTYRPLTAPPEQALTPEQPSTSRVGKAASDEDDGDKTLQKLLGNGITNDVIQYSDQITAAESQYQSLTDSEKEGPRGKHLRGIIRGNFGEINALLRTKNDFDRSVAKATANGALEEFAVTPQGFVVKKADGSIGQVSFAQLTKDKAAGELGYKPLTNSELAREREYNKQLTGNTSVISILDYGKGISEVQKEVLSIASGIGKTSTSNSTGAYDPETVEAMKEAQLKAGQGVFKVKESTSTSTNAPQIQRAKQVMWSTLGENSKNVLRARAAFLEKDPALVEQRAALLAMDLLDPRLEQSSSSTTDMAFTKGASGKGGSGGKDGQADLGATEAAVQGKTQVEHLSLLSDYGVNIDSRMYVLPKDDITKKDKDGVITPTSLASSELSKYGFISKATALNGDKIDPNQTIFTDEAYYTRIPVKRLSNGGLAIDEEGAKKFAAAEEEIARLPESQRSEMNKQTIRQKYGAQNLDVQEVILAEAASYDNKYTFGGLRGKRDAKYYKDADDQTEKLLGQVIDPDSKGPRNWIDYKAYKHLVIIPSKGEAAARFKDKNSLLVPKSGYDVTNPNRPEQTSSRSYGGGFNGSAFNINTLNQ